MKSFKNAGRILLLFFMIAILLGLEAEASATRFKIVNGRLHRDGKPFIMKGVGYSPVPIGIDPQIGEPWGDYFTSNYSLIHERDLPEIRKMGANVLRLWVFREDRDHTDFLDKAYNNGKRPLYVVPTFWIGPSVYPNVCSTETRNNLKTAFRSWVAKYKNHPAILMWSIGNELNASWNYGGSSDCLFSLIEEMAKAAHEEEGDDFHPVTTALADINLMETLKKYDPLVPSVDVWGVNIYRGKSFGTLFDEYKTASQKAMAILEFGIDAWDDLHGNEYQDTQRDYAASLWKEIRMNSGVCIGGSVMAYSDEWWKGKFDSVKAGCPDSDPAYHSFCGYATASHPDGYANEEWWGILRTKKNGVNPDILEPRTAYYRLKNLWMLDFDINGDHHEDILWQNHKTGEIAAWAMRGDDFFYPLGVATVPDKNWKIKGTGDFCPSGEPDGYVDFLWQHEGSGEIALWCMGKDGFQNPIGIATVEDKNWKIAGVGDFCASPDPDIFWHHQVTGEVAVWCMDGPIPLYPVGITTIPDAHWKIVGVADFCGTWRDDILWHNQLTGEVALWIMEGTGIVTPVGIATVSDTNWKIEGIGDFNGDNRPDILWRHQISGLLYVWFMNGCQFVGEKYIARIPETDWKIAAPK